jgi:hypothetical protein
MIMKKVIITLAAILMTIGLFAQSFTSIHYDISIPFGSSSDQVSKTSFRGAGIDFAYMVNPTLSLGFHTSLATFYQKEEEGRIVINQGEITGKQYRYMNAIPMYASARYVINKDNTLISFFGLGIGTMWSERRTDMGMYSIQDKSWRFALSPEAGILVGVPTYDLGLNLGVRYNYGFKASDSEAEQYLSFVIGVTLLGGY